MNVTCVDDVVAILSQDDAQLVRTLQDNGLLPRNFRCRKRQCRKACVQRSSYSYAFSQCFYCTRCKSYRSMVRGTFFNNKRLPFKQFLWVMWYWACEVRGGSMGMLLGAKPTTILRMLRLIRDMISWKLSQEPQLLGGVGHCVQIDGTILTKRNMGEEVWIIGMYDVVDKKGFVKVIPDRSEVTLLVEIQAVVLPGTEIWTDSWRGYNGIANLHGVSPYIHVVVNHPRQFRDPLTGVCANQVQGYQFRLKQFLRRLGVMASHFVREYVDMFMWWERYGPNRGPNAPDRMRNFIEHIKERYPL